MKNERYHKEEAEMGGKIIVASHDVADDNGEQLCLATIRTME